MNIDSLKVQNIYQSMMSAKGENERKGYLAGTIVGANGTGYAIAKYLEPLIKDTRINVRNYSHAGLKYPITKPVGKLMLFATLAIVGTNAAAKLGGAIGSLFDK